MGGLWGEGGGALTWALLARPGYGGGSGPLLYHSSANGGRWGGVHIYQGGALAYPSVPT